mmetsp:Transcript_3521/g.5891  ORF Transcript_3521/g.5891 Transcript_3521/m.5891 type:complete len:90 (+) Transcript_3521:378-647(+)
MLGGAQLFYGAPVEKTNEAMMFLIQSMIPDDIVKVVHNKQGWHAALATTSSLVVSKTVVTDDYIVERFGCFAVGMLLLSALCVWLLLTV